MPCINMAIRQTNINNDRKLIIYFMSYIPNIAVSRRQAEQDATLILQPNPQT